MDELFDAVARRLLAEEAGLERGRIFQSDGLKVEGRLCAFVTRGNLVVKLPADRVAELIAGGDGRPFDANRGRPMKEWVSLQPSDEAACTAYVREESAFVGSGV